MAVGRVQSGHGEASRPVSVPRMVRRTTGHATMSWRKPVNDNWNLGMKKGRPLEKKIHRNTGIIPLLNDCVLPKSTLPKKPLK